MGPNNFWYFLASKINVKEGEDNSIADWVREETGGLPWWPQQWRICWPAQEKQVPSLGWKDPLENGMATHSSGLSRKSCGQTSLAGYSPWSHKRLRHNLATKQKQLELPFLRRRKPIVFYWSLHSWRPFPLTFQWDRPWFWLVGISSLSWACELIFRFY